VEEVFGKPSEWMLHLALERAGVEPGELALVGDRLATDIRMGVEHGIPTVLVLSGATARADLAASPVRPDLVFEDVGALGSALSAL
jgi:ribonucleotide monophosphatase NagD (HAD superfamily)